MGSGSSRSSSSRRPYMPGRAPPGRTPQVIVRCPRCDMSLSPPDGATTFRCPCGAAMSYARPGMHAAAPGAGGSGAAAPPLRGPPPPVGPMRRLSPDSMSPMEYRIRSVLAVLPPTHPQSVLLRRVLEVLPRNADGTVNEAGLRQLQDELRREADGTPAEVLSMLPTHKYTPSMAAADKEGASECVICLDEYEEGDEMVTLPCLHVFHTTCARKWLTDHKECPLCKSNVDSLMRQQQAWVS